MPRLMRVIQVGLPLVAIAGLAYWLRFSPLAVVTHEVSRGPIAVEVLGTGTLEARVRSTVSPRIGGRVQQILVDQGDRVTAGQVLFTLDDADLRQQVEIAAANVASAEAALDRLQADEAQANAILEQTRRSHERAQQALPSHGISEQEADRALEAYRIAEAGVARATAALAEGRTQLIAAEKNRSYRETLLADTQILAPFDGLVVKRHRDAGDILAPGSPTLSLVSLDEIWVTAWVDETELSKLAVDQPARVVFRSDTDRDYQGEVARLGRETDRETREFVVDVRVLSLPENWAVGQRAEVFIETARADSTVAVPPQFLSWHGSEPGLYVISAGRAAWRPVKTGLQGRELIEIVTGVQPGDIVAMPVGPKPVSLDGRKVAMP